MGHAQPKYRREFPLCLSRLAAIISVIVGLLVLGPPVWGRLFGN